MSGDLFGTLSYLDDVSEMRECWLEYSLQSWSIPGTSLSTTYDREHSMTMWLQRHSGKRLTLRSSKGFNVSFCRV